MACAGRGSYSQIVRCIMVEVVEESCSGGGGDGTGSRMEDGADDLC